MESSNFGRSATVLTQSKYPSIQYPITTPTGRGEQTHHQLSCHPQHPIVRFTSPEPFTCMGCKEYGAGTRFACQNCDHQLHEFCALPPTTLNTHPLHPHHPLRFSSKPVKGGGMFGKRCNVCNKATAGYTFGCSCSACSFQMHPCCAMLSTEMSFPLIHLHPLILMPSTTTTGNDHHLHAAGCSPCGECNRRKRSGRVYRCTVQGCDYHLHAVCAKNMVNGLRENGIKGAALEKEKPSSMMLGAVSKIVAIVAFEFVGGLIGGLGQGVGDAIGQTITASKGPTTTRP